MFLSPQKNIIMSRLGDSSCFHWLMKTHSTATHTKKSMLKHSTQSFVAFDGLKENADVIISHSPSFAVKKQPRGSTADMLGFICSLQPDNCRSTTVPHSTHSRISQQALQASLNKSRSSLGEKFTQTSDWGLLFFPSCSHINIFMSLWNFIQPHRSDKTW